MAKERKNSNQVNPQVSPESLGSRTQAGTTCEEASALTPPTKGLLPSPPRKFLMNIPASIDCRSYHYAKMACNAAP